MNLKQVKKQLVAEFIKQSGKQPTQQQVRSIWKLAEKVRKAEKLERLKAKQEAERQQPSLKFSPYDAKRIRQQREYEENTVHFFYRWTNKTTGEYYSGIHSGQTDDGYIGSGVRFNERLAETKFTDWTREITVCHSREEIEELEEFIVDVQALADPLCLNLKTGGRFGYIPN